MMKTLAMLALGIIPFVVGCASDGEREDCFGIKCPAGYQWPDAGEVRVWAIRLPDGSVVTRYFGFFYDAAATSTDTIIPAPIGVDTCGPERTFTWQPAERAYLDVGPSITFELGDGREVEVAKLEPNPDNPDCMVPGVPCVAGIPDWFGRMHDLAYIRETFTPPDQVPSTDFYNNFQAVRTSEPIPSNPEGDRLDGIFLGPSFTVNEPVRDDMATVTLQKGHDVTFKYAFEQQMSANVTMATAIVLAPSAPVTPTACLELPTGELTIKSPVIDALAADNGFMLVGNGTDQSSLLDDGRIFHKWAIFCNFFPWQRVE